MRTEEFSRPVNLPSTDDFLKAYPRFRSFVEGTGGELYEAIIQPKVLVRAEAAVQFGYPAILAAIGTVERFWEKYQVSPGDLITKHFVGSAMCALMEANGYKKTGTKKRVPHPAFVTGEVYRLA